MRPDDTEGMGPVGTNGPCLNTDRHLWPDTSAPNAPHESLFVTIGGGIGINVGGHVIVMALSKWHALAQSRQGESPALLTSETVTLPTWDECAKAVDGGYATHLQTFIYDNEPSDTGIEGFQTEETFRRQLALLIEYERQPMPSDETPGERELTIFDRFPPFTLLQRKDDGTVVALTPDGTSIVVTQKTNGDVP